MINAIDPNQLLTQLRAMQSQAQSAPVSPQQINSNNPVDFGDLMKSAVNQVNDLQQTSSHLKTGFEMGDPNINLSDVMIASQKASVAFEATVQVRNKLVEAYQEVMRMSI
ncbi:MAG TPA: flagellar hook-basal body complex protein FliE [Methylophaga sp.]|nr:flagellar hook-basal body complex protein FliE [Methylophaga sp.]